MANRCTDCNGFRAHIDAVIEQTRQDAKLALLAELGVAAEEDLDSEQTSRMEEVMDEAEEAMDAPHEFEIAETSVEVYEDKECGKKIWVMEVQVKITDAKHPEWDGEEITMKDSIRQSEMEEC